MAGAVGLGACVLLMAPVLLFGSYALRSALVELNARSDDERYDTAALAATIVGRSMGSRAELLEQVAARDDVRVSLVARDDKRLGELLVPVVSGRPDIATAGFLDARGTVLARVPADPAAIGRSFADGDFFSGALGSEGVYIGDVVVSRVDPSLVVVTLAKAIRANGAPVGVAILTVRPAVLLGDLNALLDVSGRELLLADGHQATIASTAARPALAQIGLPALGARGLATVDGQPRAYVAAPVGRSGWTLYVLDDPDEIYTAQRAIADQLGRPLASTVVMAGALAVLLAAGYLVLMRQRTRLAAANAQLRAMNAQVEAATRAKSEFLANMSHELRTPLNAVLGFSDVLREQLADTLTDKQRRYLTNIHTAGQHLLELINDVLDISKVESGHLELRRETIAISALLEPVVASAAQLGHDRDVRFDVSDVPEALAFLDPARMRQVLLNLLSNAVKFTPAGGLVRLVVSVDGTELDFDVYDTGIGIPADKIHRAFGLFERLHEGRSDAPGTGLGLAITKKLVELHDGTIGLESHEGEGSRFFVRLPEAIVEPAVGPRILIVEDDIRDAELLTQLARDAGLTVEIAPNAASASAAIARSRPSAVILDLRLPDRRGDELLRALKDDPSTRAVPILVVSVEDDDGRARVLGAADHITKPIDRERLRRWLERIETGGGHPTPAAG